MLVTKILTALSLLGFLLYILSSKSSSSFVSKYLLYVFTILPFLGFRVIPVEMGGLSVFDALTLISIPALFAWEKWRMGFQISYFVVASLFYALIFVGALASEFPQISFVESLKYLTVLIFIGCLLYQIWIDKDFVFEVLGKLRISALFAIGFLTIQMVIGLRFSFFEPSGNAYLYDAQIRYPGMFTDPQQNAQYIAMSSFLFLAGYRDRANIGIRYLLFAVSLLGIFFTGVRAAFLGVIAGIVVLSLFGQAKFRIASLLALLSGILVYYFFKDSIVLFNRDISAGEMGDIRFEYWRAAIELFKTNTWLGIGVGNYQPFVSIFDQDQYWESFGEFEYIVHPESGYLKLLVEFGMISSIVFLSLLLQPMISSVKLWFQAPSNTKELALVLVAAVLCWMISFITVFSFADVRIVILVTTLLAVLHSVSKYNNAENA